MNKKVFDHFPSGWEVATYDLKELLYLAGQLAAEGKHEVALAVLQHRCIHTPEGKLALALLYRDAPQLSIDTRERYRRAEKLLLDLEKCFDAGGRICVELSVLYHLAHKELLSRAYLLRAARLGASLPEDPLSSTLRFLKESLDINSVSANLYASFTMGCELAKITDDEAIRFSLWLLQVVAESEETCYSPIASLFLAEYYADGKNRDNELSRKYAALSEKKGYPAILRNPHKQQ